MDYIDALPIERHASFATFEAWRYTTPRRLVLLSTKASLPYTGFAFRASDILMVGRESAGVPDSVHQAVDAAVLVPLRPPLRSLNVAVAAAMVVGEALRQIGAG